MLFKFKKPSGVEIMVNAESVKAALALGWVEVKEQQKAVKRGNSKHSNK
jgi:hypothetical protein